MKLDLRNPLVFFDLEATGLSITTDRIVEISMLKVFPDSHEESISYIVDPTINITKEVSEIHGITNEDVKGKPTFNEIAKIIYKFIEGCDIAGYNSNKFDIPLLAEEFLRVDIDFNFKKRKAIDVQAIFFKKEQRTLVAAYKFYCKKELVNAHNAMADTKATYEVLKSQLDKYDDLENDITYLSEFSSQNKNVDLLGRIIYNKEGVEVINFGKHKGKPVTEVFATDKGYYSWIQKSDFPLYTKKIFTEIKIRDSFK